MDQCCDFVGFRQVVSRMGAVVLEPTDVEVVATPGNLLACKAAGAAFFALINAFTSAIAFAAVARFEVSKVLMRQRCAFAERWHVGPQIIDPDFLCIPRVSRTPCKK